MHTASCFLACMMEVATGATHGVGVSGEKEDEKWARDSSWKNVQRCTYCDRFSEDMLLKGRNFRYFANCEIV